MAGVEYVVAMGNNAVPARHAEPYVAPLLPVVATTHDTAATYGEMVYQAGNWAAPRRTIIKAEVVWHDGREPRDNSRLVITNLRQSPKWIYTHVYGARGDSEDRLKELTLALAFGRTSCTLPQHRGIVCDQIIRFRGPRTGQKYPDAYSGASWCGRPRASAWNVWPTT